MRQTGRLEVRDCGITRKIETQDSSLLSLSGQKCARARRRTASAGKAHLRSATVRNADELMDLAVEAAQSQHLSNFLEQFALRAARMLEASWGAVIVYKGREWEFHEMPGKRGPTFPSAAQWLLTNAQEVGSEMETRALPKDIATSLPGGEQPGTVVFVRIASSNKEKLGTLCLFGKKRSEERRVGKECRSRVWMYQ